MRKINNLELASIILIFSISITSGITINIIKNSTPYNVIITLLISYIIGIIPILLIIYISNYYKDNKLSEKINILYPHLGKIFNIILQIIFVILAMTILYNSNNFITSQLLYRTPTIIISIVLLALSTYHTCKGINTITTTSFLLLIINIFLFLISTISLIGYTNIDNFLPILKIDTNKIIKTALTLSCINTLPLIMILNIPKNKLEKPEKFNKYFITSYIISCLISFIIITTTFGVLGPFLTQIFEYPEYVVLKKIKIFGFLERIENIVSNQWIIGNYIYLTFIIYYLSDNTIFIKNNNSHYSNYIYSIIIFLITSIIIKNNTIFNNFIINIFPQIIITIFIFYILIAIKIKISKKRQI